EPAAGLALEDAVTIAEATSCAAQPDPAVIVKVIGGNEFDKLADLHAVSSDVLHRCGAHHTRYERQILQTAIPSRHTPGNEVVPTLAGGSLDHNAVLIDAGLDAPQTDACHRGADQRWQDQVAASAQRKQPIGAARKWGQPRHLRGI